MRLRLAASEHAEGPFAQGHCLNSTLELVNASAKLGKTIARMKGEVRQRISVEKVANPTGIRPRFAPNFQRLHDEEPRDSAAIYGEDPAMTGGEGGKCTFESQTAADRRARRRGRTVEEVQEMFDLDKGESPNDLSSGDGNA